MGVANFSHLINLLQNPYNWGQTPKPTDKEEYYQDLVMHVESSVPKSFRKRQIIKW